MPHPHMLPLSCVTELASFVSAASGSPSYMIPWCPPMPYDLPPPEGASGRGRVVQGAVTGHGRGYAWPGWGGGGALPIGGFLPPGAEGGCGGPEVTPLAHGRSSRVPAKVHGRALDEVI